MQNLLKKIFLFLFCKLILCSPSPAQNTTYHFDNYSSKDGLPSSEVYCLLRDRDNYLWVATDHGVCRYDGYSFQQIPLPDNTVFHIRQDSHGRIWFGTYTGQLFYIENEKVFPYRYNHIILENFKNQIITDFTIANNGTVYISFMTEGMVKIDASGNFEHPKSAKTIFSIQQVDSVFFTFISNSGQRLGLPAEVEFLMPSRTPVSVSSTDTRAISVSRSILNTTIFWGRKHKAFRSANGDIIAYAGKYLFIANRNGNISTKEFPFEILCATEDSDGDLWLGFINNGVLVMSHDGLKGYIPWGTYLPGFSITDIVQDHEGGLWFTTLGSGIFYLRSKYLYFLAPGGKKLDDRINSLATVEDSLLALGTKNNGVHLYAPSSGTFKTMHVQGDFGHILYDNETRQLMAVGSGFGEIMINKASKINVNGVKFLMIEANSNFLQWKNDTYLFGRHSGIFAVDKRERSLTMLNKNVFRVGWLQKDGDDILVANQYGLWKFKDGNFYPYDTIHPLLSKRITCMEFFRDTILCMGTRGEGLLVKIRDSVYRIAEEHGLVNNNIRRILTTDHDILLATNKGLSKINIISIKPFLYTVQNLGYAEGLFVSEVNDIRRLNGVLYIATDIGLAFVDEAKAFNGTSADRNIPFHFTSIRINDRETEWKSQYNLNYRQTDITIAYTALSFRDPSGLNYRYRIFGMDTNWIYTTAREIRLTSMPYGDFTIEVQAGGRSGRWYPAVRSIHMSIEPPLWKKQWFVFLAALILAALLYWWIRRTIGGIKKREKEKTLYNKRMAEMEIRSLRAQMNPHFTFNVMQSIQYYITHHDFDSAQRYLSKFAKLMRRVLDNSRFAYISLFDEIETIKDYLDLEKLRFENELEYAIQLQSGLDPHAIKIPTMLIQPYLENAVKHGLASKKNNPRIEILINIKSGYLIVEVIDNGIGRKKAAELAAQSSKHISAGTSLVADRIEAFNKYYGFGLRSETFDLYEDDKASGTRVVLTIPIYKGHDKSIIG